jgi:FtsZ-interacting cell division protein ZipA
MNDVQLALLITGVAIIFVLIIYNWSELKRLTKKQASLTKPNNSISEDNDPLFHNFNDLEVTPEVVEPFEPIEKEVNENLTGSEKIINSNLPDGIDRDIETVISITCKKIQESSSGLLLDKIKSMPGVRVYIRKDNDLWATESAIYDSINYNQVLLVLLLASRKYTLDTNAIQDFKQLANDISSNVDGPIFWLSNQDIEKESFHLSKFKKEVDHSLILQVYPKSDPTFHAGPLIDFFKQPIFKINNKSFHELIHQDSGQKICVLTSLTGKPLNISHETFLQGIIFKMDIPNTMKITTAFNELILIIKQFNTKLNGVLVDVSRKPLNDDQISQIYVHLKKLEKIMQEKKIPSGSKIAQKMFN